MRLKIFPWLGQRFIALSWEGNGEGTVEDETRELFVRFNARLGQFGLSLDHVARTRMFTRDMDAWTESNATRASILKGKARSVSSSHIWPDVLGDKARVSIDLLAMFPPPAPEEKVLKEYDPPTIVLRRMNWGGLLFLSGVTDMTHVTFDEQFPVIIKRLTDTLADGAGSWDKVQRADFFLHHEETLEHLQESFARAANVDIPDIGYTFVGTRQGKRLEIELTARVS
jgi:hypothetical protein